MDTTKTKPMATLMKWQIVTLIPLFGLTFTSCSDDKDEPDENADKDKGTYSFFDAQHFSKQWMVSEIKADGKVRYSFEYDANNRPAEIAVRSWNISYSYDGNICTFTSKDGYYFFKGYFESNKLIKAEWDEYTVTNVTYDGNHLVKGSNGYRLTWDSNGNITNYIDQGMNFTYSEIPNKANVDFNMIIVSPLVDCWCDDGSEFFTIFGWTGARTTNLISSRHDSDGYHYEFSYTLDELGRPVEIQRVGNDRVPFNYVISYVEN